jgi:epoxyqueuosine reductase
MHPALLSSELKAAAQRLGFDLVGICPALEPPGLSRFGEWLAAGRAGEMHWFDEHREAYAHPRSVLDGARSIVMLGMNYRTREPACLNAGQARVSRYAWGTDYHDLIRGRLDELAGVLRSCAPQARTRGVVDTAPLLEREFAQLAGLGWIGKNTLLLNKQAGSWFFLAALLTDAELACDTPQATDHCGTCRACLDACPTGAFTAAYLLDPRKCISYLTIELRGPIPQELRAPMGDWLFGCDVCQDVCPWNNHAPQSAETALAPAESMNPFELAELFELEEPQFRARFRHTPLWRAKRRGLLRNAAIVLGNQRYPAALAALERGLADVEPLVRGAAAWALGQHAGERARQALDARAVVETDAYVLDEIRAAQRMPA